MTRLSYALMMDTITAVGYKSISNRAYEAALTEIAQSVIARKMGRPPIKPDLKVKKTTIWLHQPMVDRIVALVGSQGMSAFIREAVEAELKRRERKPKTGAGE